MCRGIGNTPSSWVNFCRLQKPVPGRGRGARTRTRPALFLHGLDPKRVSPSCSRKGESATNQLSLEPVFMRAERPLAMMEDYYEQVDEYVKTYCDRKPFNFEDFEIKTFNPGHLTYVMIILKALAIQAVETGVLYCLKDRFTEVSAFVLGMLATFATNVSCSYMVYRSLSHTLYRVRFLDSRLIAGAAMIVSLLSSTGGFQTVVVEFSAENYWWVLYCTLPMTIIVMVALMTISIIKDEEASEQYMDTAMVIDSRRDHNGAGTVEQILKERIETNDPYP